MINNAKDLGDAIKNKKDTIELEIDFGKKVAKVKGVGNIAWGILIAALTVAMTSTIITASSAGATLPVTGAVTAYMVAPATAAVGPSISYTAFWIAIGGGGVHVLNKLRKYKLIKLSDKYILKAK